MHNNHRSSEDYALYIQLKRHRIAFLDDDHIRLLAARCFKDHRRSGSVAEIYEGITRLVDAMACQPWGRAILGETGDRVRAKATEAESHRTRGRDASHVKVC
jgi:hypothetical protein